MPRITRGVKEGGTLERMPFWQKYMLTIREASEYFHINEDKMRRITEDFSGAPFIITSGNRVMIKRRLFEEFLDNASVI